MDDRGFNLFRLGCLVEGLSNNSIGKVTLSLIVEYIYGNGNKRVGLLEINRYLNQERKMNIPYQQLEKNIKSVNFFSIQPEESQITVKLTRKKYKKVNEIISKKSLDIHIKEFVQIENFPNSYVQAITDILYQSIYLNIMYFDPNNIKSIVPTDINKKFKQNEIIAFNEFLEAPNSEKNNALYNVFLNAFEYAIATTGKAVNNYIKHIFQSKTYYLDTSIILRAIGIDGEARKLGTIKLLNMCKSNGVNFAMTSFTYKELKDTITAKASLVGIGEKGKGNALLAGEFINENTSLINFGFYTHYSIVKSENKSIRTPKQYRFYLLTKLEEFSKKFNIFTDFKINNKKTEVTKTAKELFEKKKSLKRYVRYTKEAAKIDAQNILHIRKKRDFNNYNIQDIKFFYLTTDGALNHILQEENNLLAETILPSQLFILHSGLVQNNEEPDYELFTSFLQKRTSEFKITGKEILNYIETIREFTTSIEDTNAILKTYVTERYEMSRKENFNKDDGLKTLREIAQTHTDKKLHEYSGLANKQNSIFSKACNRFPKYFKISLWVSYFIKLTLFLLIAVSSFYLLKTLGITNFGLIILIIIIFESIKFGLSWKFGLYKKISKKIYSSIYQNSKYYKLSEGDLIYIQKAENYFDDHLN